MHPSRPCHPTRGTLAGNTSRGLGTTSRSFFVESGHEPAPQRPSRRPGDALGRTYKPQSSAISTSRQAELSLFDHCQPLRSAAVPVTEPPQARCLPWRHMPALRGRSQLVPDLHLWTMLVALAYGKGRHRMNRGILGGASLLLRRVEHDRLDRHFLSRTRLGDGFNGQTGDKTAVTW